MDANRHLRRFSFLSALLLCFSAGCEFTPPGKPIHPPTTTLAGKITLNDSPITEGWVTALPVGATTGDHRIVPIQRDGSYTFDTLPVGMLELRVRLSADYRKSLIANVPSNSANRLNEHLRQFAYPNQYLKTTTTAGVSNQYDVDLLRVPQ